MEAAGSSKTLESIYQTTRPHISEDCDINIQCCVVQLIYHCWVTEIDCTFILMTHLVEINQEEDERIIIELEYL
jgi:hypothetical protein